MRINEVSALSSEWPPSPADGLTRSLRCGGLRPSWPPADPLGKEHALSDVDLGDRKRKKRVQGVPYVGIWASHWVLLFQDFQSIRRVISQDILGT